MPDTLDDARSLIESGLAEIEVEAGRLRRALPHFGEVEAREPSGRRARRAASSSATSTRRKPSGRRAARRAPRGRRHEQLLAEIGTNPGARPSELAKSIGIRPTQVSVLIARARAKKLIVKRGEGYALKS